MNRRVAVAVTASLALVAAGCASSASPGGPPSPPVTARGAPPATRSTAPHQARLRVRLAGRLATGVSRAVVMPAGGRLLVLAGLAPGDISTARVVSLDPTSGRSRVVGALHEAAHDASGAFLRGRAVVFGGGGATELADVQDWRHGTSAVIGRLPAPRSDSAAAVVGTSAYVVGGFDGSSLARTILGTSDGSTFHVAGRLRHPVRYPAVTSYAGAVWVFGGELAVTEGTSGGPETSAIQRFDPATGATTVVGHLPHAMGHAMAFTLGGALFVAGGRRAGVAQSAIYRVDPHSGRCTRIGRLPHAFSDAAVVVDSGAAWLVGGESSGPLQPLTSVYRVTLRP